jgi:hypothetical protein
MSLIIDRPDTQSARRTRLVAEGVVAGYINDLSAAATASIVTSTPAASGSSTTRAATAAALAPRGPAG